MTLATRPKPSAHLKKRQAGHHRHSKRYLRPYWPYIPMILIIVIGLVLNSALRTNQQRLEPSEAYNASSMLQSTNIVRADHHEPELALNSALSAAAQTYAQDIVNQNIVSRSLPNGQSAWDLINNSGYSYQSIGSNIAFGFDSAADTVGGWMSSTIHRSNVIAGNYRDVGFGIARSSNFIGKGPATVVVADFGEPAASNPRISFSVPSTTQSTPVNTTISTQPVSRLQLLTGGKYAWSELIASIIALIAGVLLLAKYGIRIKKAVTVSEAFIVHHPLFDILFIFTVMLGFVLTRSAGFIQ